MGRPSIPLARKSASGSSDSSSTHTHTPTRTQKSKALLIGINYDAVASGSLQPLLFSHKNVIAFKGLLTTYYDYAEQDIVVMTDTPGQEELLVPTKENMVRELQRLVEGAQDGDRFVMYFSGHSGQIPCDKENHDEEDDQDEVMFPLDHQGIDRVDLLIVDNDLRRYLVDPLPFGARLTAFFDSCHSGTLLDLKHYTCNQVFFPWISKGKRASERTCWMRVVRRDAKAASLPPSHRQSESPRRKSSAKRVPTEDIPFHPLSAPSTPPPTTLTRARPQRAAPLRSMSLGIVQVLETAQEEDSERTDTAVYGDIMDRCTSPEPISPEVSAPLDLTPDVERMADDIDVRNPGIALSGWPMCESPDSFMCHGLCLESPTLRPEVVSVSAVRDSQVALEHDSLSMTAILVAFLETNPRPTYEHLMTVLGGGLYDSSRGFHQWSREVRTELKARGCDIRREKSRLPLMELVNFQDPQLGSEKPLNMNSQFML